MRLDGRVIYQLDPATFFDADGDGVGDLQGIVRKLDHIRAVGADTVCEALSLCQRSVFGVVHHRPGDSVLMLANLSADELEVDIPYDVRADLLADGDYEAASGRSVRLAGHGYRWLRVHDQTR